MRAPQHGYPRLRPAPALSGPALGSMSSPKNERIFFHGDIFFPEAKVTQSRKSKVIILSEVISWLMFTAEAAINCIYGCLYILSLRALKFNGRDAVAHCGAMASARRRRGRGACQLFKVDLVGEVGTLSLRGYYSPTSLTQVE
ncbi:MAG TPA: hypothetical protein VN688_04770 [Gemmataceae bacterium]|nr:hypothetical protein [Gemmataceae bacterium]